jgi:hypothetical protein
MYYLYHVIYTFERGLLIVQAYHIIPLRQSRGINNISSINICQQLTTPTSALLLPTSISASGSSVSPACEVLGQP